MARRHYVKTETGYRCVSCRQEFSTKAGLGRHYTLLGKCISPLVLGLTIDLNVSPYYWVPATEIQKAA